MKKKNQFKLGFTLVEILTTVAVIGIVATLAIPNFMRIRMNANMEIVKQYMRGVGEKMTEIMGKTGQFPKQENWPLTGSSDPDEQVVTASLSAIDGKDYTITDYATSANYSNYQFRSCPKEGKWGTAGDKCFLCTPSGVTEVEKPATGIFSPTDYYTTVSGPSRLSPSQFADTAIMLKWFEEAAYYLEQANLNSARHREGMLFSSDIPDYGFDNVPFPVNYGFSGVYPTSLRGTSAGIEQKLKNEVLPILKEKGIEIILSDSNQAAPNMNSIYQNNYFNIKFHFTDPADRITTADQYNAKISSLCASNPNPAYFLQGSCS